MLVMNLVAPVWCAESMLYAVRAGVGGAACQGARSHASGTVLDAAGCKFSHASTAVFYRRLDVWPLCKPLPRPFIIWGCLGRFIIWRCLGR